MDEVGITADYVSPVNRDTCKAVGAELQFSRWRKRSQQGTGPWTRTQTTESSDERAKSARQRDRLSEGSNPTTRHDGLSWKSLTFYTFFPVKSMSSWDVVDAGDQRKWARRVWVKGGYAGGK